MDGRMKEIGIGLLGFGTVGAGVVKGLQANGELVADRLGARPVLRKIADIDLERDRGVSVDPAVLCRDARAVVSDPSVDVVVELIGGTRVARELVLSALENRKPVVTANKALLAEHGPEVFKKAAESGVDLYFGASVGGGIPIIRALREGLIANRILSIRGILNGTSNYILTQMEEQHSSFERALGEAQQKGYAEADPSLDIDGVDTAHKAVILASLAYGFVVPMRSVHVEGVRNLSEMDIFNALALGYRIKLLAVVKEFGGDIEVRVHPALVPLDHVLASVSGVFNAVMVQGDLSGQTLYYGRGAGQDPTAGTVIADVADVVRNLVAGCPRRVPAVPLVRRGRRIRSMDEIQTRYYLRMSLLDRPGVLGQITSALGRHNVSIASVLQKEVRVGEYVPVVIVTHEAIEKDCDAALEEIQGMDLVGAKTVRLRIEE
jgi:homoserine dehydrogenase